MQYIIVYNNENADIKIKILIRIIATSLSSPQPVRWGAKESGEERERERSQKEGQRLGTMSTMEHENKKKHGATTKMCAEKSTLKYTIFRLNKNKQRKKNWFLYEPEVEEKHKIWNEKNKHLSLSPKNTSNTYTNLPIPVRTLSMSIVRREKEREIVTKY